MLIITTRSAGQRQTESLAAMYSSNAPKMPKRPADRRAKLGGRGGFRLGPLRIVLQWRLNFRVPAASCRSKRRGFDFIREIARSTVLGLSFRSCTSPRPDFDRTYRSLFLLPALRSSRNMRDDVQLEMNSTVARSPQPASPLLPFKWPGVSLATRHWFSNRNSAAIRICRK